MTPQLSELSIGYKRFARAVEIIDTHPGSIDKLTVKSSDGDTFPPNILDALISHPKLANLKRLVVDEVDLGRETLTTLMNSRHLEGLERVAFYYCDWGSRLDDEFAQIVADSVVARGLETLSLSRIKFGPRGVERLAAAPLSKLKRLELLGCDAGDQAVDRLVESRLWNQLEVVLLSEKLSRRGIERLLAAGRPPRLHRIWIADLRTQPEVQEELRAVFGDAYGDSLTYNRWEGEGAV